LKLQAVVTIFHYRLYNLSKEEKTKHLAQK